MAQKVTGYIKLQIPAAKATASPPVGPALGQHGVNIAQFIREFNDRTKDQAGFKIPVVITVYADRSFSFVTKTPPTPTLILKAIGQEKGSGVPNKNKVGTITKAQVREIAERKMPDLTAATIEAAMTVLTESRTAAVALPLAAVPVGLSTVVMGSPLRYWCGTSVPRWCCGPLRCVALWGATKRTPRLTQGPEQR